VLNLKTAESDKARIAPYPDIVYRGIVIFFVLAVSSFLLPYQSPALFDHYRRLLLNAFSMGHIPLFGVLSWMSLMLINVKVLKIREWPMWSYGAAFFLTLGASFLSEAIQIVTPRDASIKDFMFNNLGIILFLGAGLVWFNNGFADLSGRWYKTCKIFYVLTTVLIVFYVVRPFVFLLVEEMEIRKSFPVIASFETTRELKRWKGGNEKTLSQAYVDDGNYSLRVNLRPARFSGIDMFYPPNDWRGYDAFNCTIFNPSKNRLEMVLKIFDRGHNYKYSDRLNKILTISPGRNDIAVPFREIESAPKGRNMHMGKIAQVSFFVRGLKKTQVLYFDNIRLSSESRK
jgi:hypothetical protein